MATLSVQHKAAHLALVTLLFGGMWGAHADDQLDSGMTVLVYDYAGVQADILLKAEQETSRIFRHSGVDVTWRPCRMPGSSVAFECPEPGPTTPALRLVPRLKATANRVHVEAMGYCTGDFATVSVEFARELEESGVARRPQILGHIMAHEIGHLLLPGNGHSVSGIMRGHWSRAEWALIQQGRLNFAPEQSRFLRAELLNRVQPTAKETR
jgi:hypothetical protein